MSMKNTPHRFFPRLSALGKLSPPPRGGATGVVFALAAADVANPPDMTRYANVSPEVVDKNGVLLRPFLTKDGYWRLRTDVGDVNPRYLALLKAYEDKRFDDHWGVDPIAVLRAGI